MGYVAENTAGYHLGNGNVLSDLIRRLIEEMEETGRENSGEYRVTSKQIQGLEGDNLS